VNQKNICLHWCGSARGGGGGGFATFPCPGPLRVSKGSREDLLYISFNCLGAVIVHIVGSVVLPMASKRKALVG